MKLREIFVSVALSVCITVTSQAQTLLPDENNKKDQVKTYNKKQDYLRKVKADIELKQVKGEGSELPDSTRIAPNPKAEQIRRKRLRAKRNKQKLTPKPILKKQPIKKSSLKKDDSYNPL